MDGDQRAPPGYHDDYDDSDDHDDYNDNYDDNDEDGDGIGVRSEWTPTGHHDLAKSYSLTDEDYGTSFNIHNDDNFDDHHHNHHHND